MDKNANNPDAVEVIPPYDRLMHAALEQITQPALAICASVDHLSLNRRCELLLGLNRRQLIYLRKIKQFSIRGDNCGENDRNLELVIYDRKVKLRGRRVRVDNYLGGWDLIVFNDSVVNYGVQEEAPITFETIIGRSKVFAATVEACRLAETPGQYVLLLGESGTGKETLARCMHAEGPFPENNFVCLRNNFEFTEFFKTAYESDTFQYDERIWGHTIYIDEIANFNHYNQDRLFMLLRNSGSGKYKVICASSADLGLLLRRGEWHRNLYDILNTSRIDVPAIRHRREDIPLFAEYLLRRVNVRLNRRLTLSDELTSQMCRYDWYGNLHEMESFLISAVNVSDMPDGRIPARALDDLLSDKASSGGESDYSLARAEKALILKALNDFNDSSLSKNAAAKALGIGVSTLYRKIELYGISKSESYEG